MSSNTSKMLVGSGAKTRVSHYDSLNAILISAIVLVGFLVTLLFIIWLTMILDFQWSSAGDAGCLRGAVW